MAKANGRSNGIARWKVVYDALRSELTSYQYGSDFHTVSEVCRRFKVSSITAIRSLNELSQEGLIEKIPGKGNVVRRVPRDTSLWMVMPAGKQEEYLAFDSVCGRRIRGVREAVREQDVEVGAICESRFQNLFPRVGERSGFLFFSPVRRATVDFLQAHHLPFVFVDPLEDFEGVPHARIDRVQVGYLSTCHLLELGHRQIGWITSPSSLPNFGDRIKGYRAALREAGIPFTRSLITEAMHGPDALALSSCESALDSLLQLPQPPTAIIAGDVSRAIHILDICRRRGIDVPGQLSVLGHPNISESRLTQPPLSVMDSGFEAVGEAAVKLVIEQMYNGSDPARQAVVIKPELFPRASTGPAPDPRQRLKVSSLRGDKPAAKSSTRLRSAI